MAISHEFGNNSICIKFKNLMTNFVVKNRSSFSKLFINYKCQNIRKRLVAIENLDNRKFHTNSFSFLAMKRV